MQADHQLSMDVPRTVGQIVDAVARCYWRRPLLFFTLALAVVGPYDLIVLATTRAAPLATGSTNASTALTLSLISLGVVAPFVSALHVHAVAALGAGRRASVKDVGWRGLRALPVVVAAQIVAALGIGVGLLLFLVPGIFLAIRWQVVAQSAAIERTDWIGALRRSNALTRGHMWHVLAVTILGGVFSELLRSTVSLALGSSRGAGSVAVAIVVDSLAQSVVALLGAVLYFDLRAREAARRPA
jgi:hypothetical protein